MDITEIINLIISEPVYLSIVVLFLLAFIYSVLKKFFKLLVIVLMSLIGYVAFLVSTNQDLPGDVDVNVLHDKVDDYQNIFWKWLSDITSKEEESSE